LIFKSFFSKEIVDFVTNSKLIQHKSLNSFNIIKQLK